MPCRFASSGTVATSRSASRAILALNVASDFLRDLVISVLHPLRQSRTLHTLTFGPISGVHFKTMQSNVPLGHFVLKYATGNSWCGETGMFGTETEFHKADVVLRFTRQD